MLLVWYLVFLALVLTIKSYTALESGDLSTLKLVQVLMRHGKRTPLVSLYYPTCPYKDALYLPFGPDGQLTTIGKRESYQAGLEMRQRYKSFLNDTYYKDYLEAISSDQPRTQMTLQAVLAGLYPPTPKLVVDPNLNWQPIPYHVQKSPPEPDLFGECSMHFVDVSLNLEQKMVYRYMSKFSGWNVNTSGKAYSIYDTIVTQLHMGIPVPKWALPIYPQPLIRVSTQYFDDKNKHILPQSAGFMVQKITNETLAKMEGRSDKQIIIYLGHDTNMAALLGAFGAYNSQPIKYSAYILMEFHQINGKFGLKVFLKNGQQDLTQIFIKGCGEFCEIDNFVKLTRSLYIPEPDCSQNTDFMNSS